jgi:AcrR family transcriptional regulator
MSKKERGMDPRVRRTRKLLRDALIELIPEKGYNDITVKDITERATLNRATFYLHYHDKDELLEKGFDEIWNELTSKNPLPVEEDGALALNGTRITVMTDFEHLEKYDEFYRVMLGKKGAAEFTHRLVEHVYETTASRLEGIRGDLPSGPVPIDLVLKFIASAYVGIIQWWLENDKPYSPEEMASFFIDLYNMSPFQAMGLTTR